MDSFKKTISNYLERKRIQNLEQYLPDALYQMSSSSNFSSLENILKEISKSNYGELSKEFKICYNEIKTGSSLEKSLINMIKRNDSFLLKRALNIILVGIETGSDLSKSLEETAEDFSKTFAIEREKHSGLLIQKYTLLLGATIIVPLILGLMTSLVTNLNFNFELFENTKNLAGVALLSNRIYLGIFALMSSFFLALQEDKPENKLVYLLAILPISQIIFYLSFSLKII